MPKVTYAALICMRLKVIPTMFPSNIYKDMLEYEKDLFLSTHGYLPVRYFMSNSFRSI